MKEESIHVSELLMVQRLEVQLKSLLNELVLLRNSVLFMYLLFMQIHLTADVPSTDSAVDVVRFVPLALTAGAITLCPKIFKVPPNVNRDVPTESTNK